MIGPNDRQVVGIQVSCVGIADVENFKQPSRAKIQRRPLLLKATKFCGAAN